MGQIRITPDIMRERAGSYRTQAEAVAGVITEMDNLLSALQDEWEGSASKAYAEKYDELRPGFVSAQELIESIAAALDETANAIEEVDENIAGQY